MYVLYACVHDPTCVYVCMYVCDVHVPLCVCMCVVYMFLCVCKRESVCVVNVMRLSLLCSTLVFERESLTVAHWLA